MTCNCGEEHNHIENQDETSNDPKQVEKNTIYLTLEDESKLKCQVVKIFEVGDKEYIALFPEHGQKVFLYGYENTKDGPQLSSIEDDSEYHKLVEHYNGMLE